MKTLQRRAFSAASAIIVITGAVYSWMKYWLVTDDPFAVVNHPLQPLVLHAHVLAGPVFLILFGIVFDAHVSRALRAAGGARRSGVTSLVTVLTMVASGYLLQVATGDQARRVMVVVHLISGALFAVSYLTHLVTAWRRWRALSQPQPARS